MSAVLALCVAVLIIAAPLAWWIKREGERSYARHQRMAREAAVREAFHRFSAEVGATLIPAFERFSAQMRAMQPVLAKMAAAMEKAGQS
jgi:hypothetical protein